MTGRTDPDWWKKIFDGVYLLTDARSVCDVDLTRREVDLLLEVVPLRRDWKILDLCGGQGRHALELARRGFTGVTVLDFSKYLIEEGKKAAAQEGLPVEFMQGDARDTGHPSEAFHAVMLLGNSFGYLPDKDEDFKILKEAFRLLSPGGWLVMDVSNGDEVRRKFNPIAWHEIGDDIVVCRERTMKGEKVSTREVVLSKKKGLIRDACYSIRLYDERGLRSLVTRAGFTIEDALTGVSLHEKGNDYGFMNSRILLTARRRGRTGNR